MGLLPGLESSPHPILSGGGQSGPESDPTCDPDPQGSGIASETITGHKGAVFCSLFMSQCRVRLRPELLGALGRDWM